jgi:predicted ATP-grasp superfamily ATP-dependent carboligase
MKALVLSAETASAVATVRGLHAAGFEVVVLAQAWHSPAGMSRCCAQARRVGVWRSEHLPALVAEIAPRVVVPVTEGDLARLAPLRAEVEKFARVVAPPAEALDEATDKAFTSRAAEALGVGVPAQWVLAPSHAPGDAPPAPFPLVAKPARSRVLRADGTVWGGTAGYFADVGALRARHAEHAAVGVATIVQRPVAGEAVLVSVLLREDGERSLVFAHRRVREARPEGGPSACAVSAEPDARLVDAATMLARGLRLVGVPAQFEFRVPPAGAPVLLDVNPRPWGTLGLANDCGVNFYGLAARHAAGDPLPAPPPPYRAGVVRHSLAFEVRRAWTVVCGTPQPGFPGPWPDKLTAAFDWVFLPHEGLVGKLDDPLPAFGDAVRLIARALQRSSS